VCDGSEVAAHQIAVARRQIRAVLVRQALQDSDEAVTSGERWVKAPVNRRHG